MKNGTRRTTLTLPVKTLAAAERAARKRKISRNAAISEMVEDGLRMMREAEERAKRSEQVLKAYRRAFSGLNEKEMMAVDGIVLSEPTGH